MCHKTITVPRQVLTQGHWAHARSGEPIAIAAYLGKADLFDLAITEFAAAYADQNERDYQALATAAATGRITVHSGL
jgi:hypothetical protein